MRSRRVLVSGGRGNIGEAICAGLRDAGWTVISVDKTPVGEKPEQDSVVQLVGDVANADAFDGILGQIIDHHGLPNLVVNCVGQIHNEPITSFQSGRQERHDLARWGAVLESNLTAPFVVSRAVSAQCIRQRLSLSIVNFSSISARGRAGQAAYAASKAGLEAFTRSMALELGALNVRCNAIALGFIDTHSMRANVSPDRLKVLQSEIALKRFGDLRDVVGAVMFCADNQYLNGTTLHLDGGLCA